MSYVNIPFVWPFKMVPCTAAPGIHFDDLWAHEQIKRFERKVRYQQKWEKADTTPLQVEASIYPGDLKLYDKDRVLVKTFAWTPVVDAIAYKIYQTTFDMSDKPEGVYFAFMDAGFDKPFISEPIHIKASWINTLPFLYKNSFNKDGVAWTTGIKMLFRCEAGIESPAPERDRTAYTDQVSNVETLYSIPQRVYKLLIGEAPGVAPYVLDILNRIFCCDYVSIKGKQYETPINSKWDRTIVKGYPLIGASIDLVEALNTAVLQQTSGAEGSGFVTAYDIETGWFGSGTITPVLEVLENQ